MWHTLVPCILPSSVLMICIVCIPSKEKDTLQLKEQNWLYFQRLSLVGPSGGSTCPKDLFYSPNLELNCAKATSCGGEEGGHWSKTFTNKCFCHSYMEAMDNSWGKQGCQQKWMRGKSGERKILWGIRVLKILTYSRNLEDSMLGHDTENLSHWYSKLLFFSTLCGLTQSFFFF